MVVSVLIRLMRKQVHENEVARAYKTVNDAYIEPISFVVPRRAEVFQSDIYPPTFGLKSSVPSSDWFDGKTALPPLISLKGKYDGDGSDELSPEEKALVSKPKEATVSNPPPTKTEPPAPAPAPAAVAKEPVQIALKGEMKDNKQAMSAMASKFADKEDEDDDDDASSFEEVTKPVERQVRSFDPPKPTQTAAPVAAASTPRAAPATAAVKPTPAPSAPEPIPEPARSGGPAEVLKGHFSDIKSAQAGTRSEIAELKEQVGDLKDLVKSLASRLDTLVDSQAERMRRIELEVEGLRD
jgi:coronin-1B/1C/6